jgi:hypothetical protein
MAIHQDIWWSWGHIVSILFHTVSLLSRHWKWRRIGHFPACHVWLGRGKATPRSLPKCTGISFDVHNCNNIDRYIDNIYRYVLQILVVFNSIKNRMHHPLKPQNNPNQVCPWVFPTSRPAHVIQEFMVSVRSKDQTCLPTFIILCRSQLASISQMVCCHVPILAGNIMPILGVFFVLDMAGLWHSTHVGTLEKKAPWTGILSSWISPPYQASE